MSWSTNRLLEFIRVSKSNTQKTYVIAWKVRRTKTFWAKDMGFYEKKRQMVSVCLGDTGTNRSSLLLTLSLQKNIQIVLLGTI